MAHQDADGHRRYYDLTGHGRQVLAEETVRLTTRSSGRSHAAVHRRVKKPPPGRGGPCLGAFAALTASPGARAHYDRRKHHGDRHATVLRNLCNRFLGCLFPCLTTRRTYQEHTAFA